MTLLEFVDFECPACRAQYGEMEKILAGYEGRIDVVFKNLPLPQHRYATDAARAFCCAEEKGQAMPMADRMNMPWMMVCHITPASV